nr:hypothetical protein [Mycoplasmopsis bovis]
MRTKNVGYGLYVFWATTFNKDISGWNVENVSTMEEVKTKLTAKLSWLAKVKIAKDAKNLIIQNFNGIHQITE